MKRRQIFSSIGRIVAVTSCKGGVGKSTVSWQLANRLAARGHRVGLLDADVHGPSLPSQAITGDGKGVAPCEDGWSMLPLAHAGLKLMSFGWLRSKSGELIWGPEAEVDPRAAGTAGALAVQLLHTTAWGELDYLLIDTPPGTGEVPMALAARANLAGAICVTTPSKLAVADVVRGVAMLQRFEVPVLAVVENMASFRCCSCDELHFPFGRGHLESVLASIEAGGSAAVVPSFRLPIVPAGGEDNGRDVCGSSFVDDGIGDTSKALDNGFSREFDALALALESNVALAGKPPVELPQLAWHERPHWPNKLYFSSQKSSHGARTRHRSDREFKILPPD